MLSMAVEVANQLIDEFFPNCNVALLSGSYVRGEHTTTSDLDIVVIDESYEVSFRKSFYYQEYPVECFVHNKESYQAFIESDVERARPSLLNMIQEGMVLKDDGFAEPLKQEAEHLLNKGPKMWSADELAMKRYMLTDVLEDFEGCTNPKEGIFIAAQLANQLHEFILRLNGHWIGSGKWVYRALKKYNVQVAEELIEAVDTYYKSQDKQPLIRVSENWLNNYGGKHFDGFQLGKMMKK